MSSNQWELVTKPKKQKYLEKKAVARTEKKRLAELGPKLEEILPSHQYRSLLTGKTDKEGHSPAKSTSSSTKSKTSPKKSGKTAGQVSVKEVPEPKKQQPKKTEPKKPKSLESAFRNLDPQDFASELERFKLIYPGSELLWLKAVASYLNSQLPFDCDPTFSGKSVSYPSNLASSPFKEAVVDFLESVGEINLEYFYHTLLVSMTMDLNNNLPVVGYKFLLQVIAQNWPQICSNNMAKTAMLRNSYQNRSNICLSILWVVGQGGYQNLMEGIKVWQNLMLPNLEMKNYCKFVTEYIEKVLNCSVNQSLNLNQNEFFATYNVLKSVYSGIPRDLQQSLRRSSEVFLQKFIAQSSKHANLFLTLLRDIEDSARNHIELDGCLSCMLHGDDCFKVWKMNYKKQLLPTMYLLEKIDTEIEDSAAELASSEAFDNFLSEAEKLNAELSLAKRRDPNLDTIIKLVASVQEKAAQLKKKQAAEQQKKCGCCKWVLGSIVLIALIAGVLIYDTERNGKGVFAKSATGKVLQNAGLLPYVEKAWYTTMGASARGYKWAEQHVPPYVKPVCELCCDLLKFSRNAACNVCSALKDFFNAKWPVAANFLDQYIPGLSKKIEYSSESVKNITVDAFDKTAAFFRTKVLVGNFSPESLRKTLNQTTNMALEYYNVFHRKIDAYAKLK